MTFFRKFGGFDLEIVEKEWQRTWSKVIAGYDYAQQLKKDEVAQSYCLTEILSRYIKKGSLVLEAGCGYGLRCLYFNSHNEASCIGVDIVLEPLKLLNLYLKTNKKDTQVSACDVTRIPFIDCVFEAVTSFGVIEHFRSESEVAFFLNDAIRVLKKGGVLIITIPNFAATFRNKLVLFLSHGKYGLYHKTYSQSMLLNLVNSTKDLRIVETGFTPFGFKQMLLHLSVNKHLFYILYHAIWKILNSFLTSLGRNYQDPIYVIAKKTVA